MSSRYTIPGDTRRKSGTYEPNPEDAVPAVFKESAWVDQHLNSKSDESDIGPLMADIRQDLMDDDTVFEGDPSWPDEHPRSFKGLQWAGGIVFFIIVAGMTGYITSINLIAGMIVAGLSLLAIIVGAVALIRQPLDHREKAQNDAAPSTNNGITLSRSGQPIRYWKAPAWEDETKMLRKVDAKLFDRGRNNLRLELDWESRQIVVKMKREQWQSILSESKERAMEVDVPFRYALKMFLFQGNWYGTDKVLAASEVQALVVHRRAVR